MRAIATTTQQNPGAIGIAHGAEGDFGQCCFYRIHRASSSPSSRLLRLVLAPAIGVVGGKLKPPSMASTGRTLSPFTSTSWIYCEGRRHDRDLRGAMSPRG